MTVPDRERAVLRIAEAQRGMITHEQLLNCGFSRNSIARRRTRGWLHPIHRGVYSVGGVLPELARETAAVLACGDGAVLSHHSAAGVWGIRPLSAGGQIHTTVVGRNCGSARGVRVHRVRSLDPVDVRRMQNLALTAPARTLIDIAADLSGRELERAFDEALVRGLVTRGSLRAGLARNARRRGSSAIRTLAEADRKTTRTRSEAEEVFLALVRRAHLPDPEVNVNVGGIEVDFLWRRERLVVEIDGFAYHRGRWAFERDHERDAELMQAGFLVIRVTWRQLERQPEAVLVRVATALARQASAGRAG